MSDLAARAALRDELAAIGALIERVSGAELTATLGQIGCARLRLERIVGAIAPIETKAAEAGHAQP